MTVSPAKQAWSRIVEQLQTFEASSVGATVRPVILESWRRSRDAGVNPSRGLLLHRVEVPELQRRQAANRRLLAAAMEPIDNCSAALRSLKHVLYMTDRDGIVLYARGTETVMQAYGLRPGFDWSEEIMGTNGAGTAIACNAPVAVTGPEHWTLPFHDASCLASPIRGADGNPIGAVDLSTHVSDCQPAHLELIIQVAQEIERRLSAADPRARIRS